MSDDKMKAFALGRQAAALDFEGALQGLLAGHAEAIKKIQDAYVEKDMAFLMALALSEKGARLDKDGHMLQRIADGLRGKSLSPVEQRLVDRANA